MAGAGLHIRRSQARKVVGTPKNKHARFQPLPDDLVQRLRRYLLTTQGQRLFAGDRGGALSNNVLNRALRAACRSADVREVSSHGLRRTAGSSYGFLGQSQRAIASMLGHTDLKATERYVRVHEAHRHQLVERRWAGAKGSSEGVRTPTEAPFGTAVGDLVGELVHPTSEMRYDINKLKSGGAGSRTRVRKWSTQRRLQVCLAFCRHRVRPHERARPRPS